jgi:hypothetical protein
MRPTRPNARLMSSAALAAVFASAMVVAPVAAYAEDDVAPDTKFLRGMMEAIGLQSPNKPVIQYHERAPLVIPQSDSLPPPQTPGAAVANNPAWPKDADRARANLEKERKRNRDTSQEIEDESRPLNPGQLTPGRGTMRARVQRPNDPAANASVGNDGSERLNPNELGYKGGLFGNMFGGDDKKEQNARFLGEPPRTTLTQPPQGYQTPSPDQPYGLGNKQAAPKAVDSYTTRGELQR